MIRQGIKKYVDSLKYVFTPLGVMFLGIIIGLSILIPGIFMAFSTLSNGVKTLSSTINLDAVVLFNDIWSSVRSLDWNDPVSSLQTIFSSEWINNNLMNTLNSILGSDFETFKSQIVTLVGNFTISLVSNVIVFFVLWILGFVVGFSFTEFQMRKDNEKKSFGKLLFETLINGLFSALLILFAIFLFILWRWSIVVSLILMLILVNVFALFEANIMLGKNKKTLKDIFDFNKVKHLVLSSAIIYSITVVITIILILINFVLGIFIGLALIQIAHTTININAQNYVCSIENK